MTCKNAFNSLAMIEPGVGRADIGEQWLQGRSVFGGLQAVLGVRAMRALLTEPLPLRTLQTTFIAPLPCGEVRVEARLLRAGKSTVHAEARLFDGDQPVCLIVAVFGAARPSTIAIAPPPVVEAKSPAQSAELPFIAGITPAFLQMFRMRWADGAFPFCGGSRASTQIWVELRDTDVIDESAVIALADSIPSPALSLLRRPSPASSLTWTLEFLRAHVDSPAAPWLMDASMTAAGEGYGAQTATLFDQHGQAVALSRQSVVIFG